MRKPLVISAVLVTAVFGSGYVIGQLTGATSSAAAGSVATATAPSGPDGHRVDWGPHRASGPHADGTITSVQGNTISIKADTDPANSNEHTAVTTIRLTSSTQYDAGGDGTVTAARPTFAVGEYVVAEGAVSSDGSTLTASRVSVRPAGALTGDFRHGDGGYSHGPEADGQVTAVAGDTVTIKPDARDAGQTAVTTVILTSATRYDSGHDSAASASKTSIVVGAFIRAEGTLNANGTALTASQVTVMPSAPGSGGPDGESH